MRSNYKKLGDFIQQVNNRNNALSVSTLLGVSIQKCFMPSIANTIGTDMSTYKIIKNKQFAYGPVTSRNGDKISIALLEKEEEAILSQAYTVFEIIDHNVLDPEYLMMWFRRPEFDRYARFKSHGSAREVFDWFELCETELPIPSIEKQREIVREYNTIVNRIALNEQLIQKLEETAQAIYKRWFVEFEFPFDFAQDKLDHNGKPYKSSGGEMVWCEELEKEIPVGWYLVNLSELVDNRSTISYGVVKPGDEVEDGVKFVRSGDISNGQIDLSQLRTISDEISKQYKRTILQGGEIVISIVGNPGQVAIVPNSLCGANLARQVALVRMAKTNTVIYVKNYLISGIGNSLLNDITIGSVQDVINLSDLRNLKVLLPPNKVLEMYNFTATVVQNNQNLVFNENDKMRLLKDIVLAKMTKVEDVTEKEINV